jgi:hypothetical protein
MVAVLAAALALTEIGAKSSQNAYLTHHIAVSDDYGFYQAKSIRAAVRSSEITLLSIQPNAAEPQIQGRIKDAETAVARFRDDPTGGEGMKQLLAKAEHDKHIRDHAEHKYHGFEYAAGGLEIAIVLCSVSVVTRMKPLAIAAGGIGLLSGLASAAVALGFN